jgi:hypothetical protein
MALYINIYNADRSIQDQLKIIKIERRPKNYIKTAIKIYLENGCNIVFPTINDAKREIITRAG